MRSRTTIFVPMLLALCACASQGGSKAPGIVDTGVSTSGSGAAVWFATPRPGLSAVGKDYLFVGPVTVNRDGRRRGYLWFAIGTTIDRKITGAPPPRLESVVLLVDGTPMTFDLVPWDGQGAGAPYDLSVAPRASYMARVTASQLATLAGAADVRAWVTGADGRSPLYDVVQGDPRGWSRAGSPAIID